MDREVVDRKLESIRRSLVRIKARVPSSAIALESDLDAQDIICVNLERAVQACVDIASHILSQLNSPVPETLASCFDVLRQSGVISDGISLRMKKAVGFRNIAVHEYETIDWKIVYSIATKNIDDFKCFMTEIDCWLSADLGQE